MSPLVQSFLLARRGGTLWGVANAVVEGRNGKGAFRIRCGEDLLVMDEVLDVVEGVRIHPAGRLLARWWPEAVAGLAIHRHLPVLVIGPGQFPDALRETPGSGS